MSFNRKAFDESVPPYSFTNHLVVPRVGLPCIVPGSTPERYAKRVVSIVGKTRDLTSYSGAKDRLHLDNDLHACRFGNSRGAGN